MLQDGAFFPQSSVLILHLLLSMSSSDEDEVGAIQRAQAVARARGAAQPAQPDVESPVLEAHAALFEELCDGMLAESQKRRTCSKDKLPVKCRHCADGTRKPCAYKTGEWDPPTARDTVSRAAQQQEDAVRAPTAAEQSSERRKRMSAWIVRQGRRSQFWEKLPDWGESF